MIDCKFTQQVWTEMLTALKINLVGQDGTCKISLRIGVTSILFGTCFRPLSVGISGWKETQRCLRMDNLYRSVIYIIMGWLGRKKKKMQYSTKTKLPPKINFGKTNRLV
jgi:hypothetical protein